MFSSSKPYTAVTVQIERMTSPEYDADEWSGIVDLMGVISIQKATGPAEAARALRKKLKYGSAHRQLRALNILDGLFRNAGPDFQRRFADEALLERLRILPRDEMVDREVRERCIVLFGEWARSYRGVQGMASIAQLKEQLPNKKRPTESQSKVVRETEREAQENPFGSAEDEMVAAATPASPRRGSQAPQNLAPAESSSNRPRTQSTSSFFGSSKKDKDKKKKTNRHFNLEREKPNIMSAIANGNMASTNLLNALKHVNRETHRVAEDRACLDSFERCKVLRRQILRYIQFVETDQLIGSLLSANDELVKALMAFEIMDKSIDDDSDSDAEGGYIAPIPGLVNAAGRNHSRNSSQIEEQMKGLSMLEQAPAKPPRPAPMDQSHLVKTPLTAGPPPLMTPAAEEDEDDPFGDRNAI